MKMEKTEVSMERGNCVCILGTVESLELRNGRRIVLSQTIIRVKAVQLIRHCFF